MTFKETPTSISSGVRTPLRQSDGVLAGGDPVDLDSDLGQRPVDHPHQWQVRGHRTLHAQWSQLLRLLMSGHYENGWGGLIGTFDKVVHVPRGGYIDDDKFET